MVESNKNSGIGRKIPGIKSCPSCGQLNGMIMLLRGRARVPSSFRVLAKNEHITIVHDVIYHMALVPLINIFNFISNK